VTVALGAAPPQQPGRIAELVKQLGDDDFTKREAASKELDVIGEPALAALRKAVGSPDLEVRRRADRLVRASSERVTEAAIRRKLASWEGTWRRSDGAELTIKGSAWAWGKSGKIISSGKIRVVEVHEAKTKADFLHTASPVPGHVALAIVNREGGVLYYSGGGPVRPTKFSKDDAFKAIRK
jgi:hypothetical protein